METFFIRAAQLILSLSILVVLHELGHFSFARLFRVRVDKFYVFFNPKFSLIRAKKMNGKWNVKFFASNVPSNERMKLDATGNTILSDDGKTPVMEPVPLAELPDGDWRRHPEHTEWGIGWLPLGGYCKIAGMIDESMDKTQLNQPVKPWEFRSRSVWQRLLIIAGGVFVNFLLAMVIYSAVLFHWGRKYVPLENAKYGLNFSQTMIDAGFRDGDKIIGIDGKTPAEISDAVEMILIDYAKNVTVERNGQRMDLDLPDDLTQKVLKVKETAMSFRFPFVVNSLTNGSPAEKANLQHGDSIIAVNGKQMSIYQEVTSELSNSKNSKVTVTFVRNGTPQHAELQLGDDGKMGVYPFSPERYLKFEKQEYGLLASIPAGIKMGWDTLVSYIKQFKLVFTKEGVKSLGSFGAIGSLFPPSWDWQSFWLMTAFISIILAFMNFLPIPGLDGGFILFLLYEMITRRKPSDKFMEHAQMVGMILLMLLFVYATGNDIFRAFFK